jgi:hypothetical protein
VIFGGFASNQRVKDVLSFIKDSIATLAFIVGGTWVAFRFITQEVPASRLAATQIELQNDRLTNELWMTQHAMHTFQLDARNLGP